MAGGAEVMSGLFVTPASIPTDPREGAGKGEGSLSPPRGWLTGVMEWFGWERTLKIVQFLYPE